MTIESFAANFVDAMDVDTVITWAAILSVPHDKYSWVDDEWPDKTDELRVAVTEAMLKVGKKPQREPLGKTLADCFDTLIRKDPNNPMPLGDR